MFKDTRGYILVYCPTHPNAMKDGYIAEHRLVMSNHIRRPLKKEERVHHINNNKSDNRLENLQLFSTEKEHLSQAPHAYTDFICKGREKEYAREYMRGRKGCKKRNLGSSSYRNGVTLELITTWQRLIKKKDGSRIWEHNHISENYFPSQVYPTPNSKLQNESWPNGTWRKYKAYLIDGSVITKLTHQGGHHERESA